MHTVLEGALARLLPEGLVLLTGLTEHGQIRIRVLPPLEQLFAGAPAAGAVTRARDVATQVVRACIALGAEMAPERALLKSASQQAK